MFFLLMSQVDDVQLYEEVVLSELLFMPFGNENLQIVFEYSEKFECRSYLTFQQQLTGFVSFLLLDRSFLLIPAHLENETSKVALKLVSCCYK